MGSTLLCLSRRVLAILSTLALAALAGMAEPRTARADDFRMHTKVFAGAAKEPVSENTTIFHEGLVYDFIEKPSEVLLFDAAGGRFVLLDPQRQRAAEITLAELDALLPELKQKLAARDDFAAFLANPQLRVEAGEAAGDTHFVAPWMRYQVRAAPAPSDAVAGGYAAFSAHSTRLAALRRAPLLARVVVNDWLNERKLIPESVRLTMYAKDRAGKMLPEAEFRSEHAIKAELADDDLARVAQAARWRAEFRRVGLTTYWTAGE